MVIQTTNIVAGFILAAPFLKTFGAKEHIEKAQLSLHAFAGTIGLIELIIGLLALVHRLGIVFLPIPSLGASFPQALPAIAIGLILSAHLFEKYPAMHDLIGKLKVYSQWIGLLGIAVGLGSILFGCFIPGLCGGYGYYY